MVRQRQGDQLDRWLVELKDTGAPEVRSFALGLETDYAAVKADLTLVYSNGQTEAQIQRLKPGPFGRSARCMARLDSTCCANGSCIGNPRSPITRCGSEPALLRAG